MNINNEMIKEINESIDEKYQVLGFVDEYKNVNTRCIVKCEIHGNGNDWENPWNPTISKLKLGRGCPKCSNVYKPTKEESLLIVNELTDDKIKILDFIGEYKGSKTKCIITCKTHGNGNDWENPWTPTIDALKSGKGCPKCSNRYQETEKEALINVNKLTDDKIKVIGFVGGYKGSKTKCLVQCQGHGNGSDWKTPWTPTIDNLKSGKGCPKCSGKYQETEQEALININKQIKDDYKVLGFIGEYKGVKTKCIIECKIHGNGNDWERPWNPNVNTLKKGIGCSKCAGNYKKIIKNKKDL